MHFTLPADLTDQILLKNKYMVIPIQDDLGDTEEVHVVQGHVLKDQSYAMFGHKLCRHCWCNPVREPAPVTIWVHKQNL